MDSIDVYNDFDTYNNNNYDMIDDWMLDPSINPIATGGRFELEDFDPFNNSNDFEVLDAMINLPVDNNDAEEEQINQPFFVLSDFEYIDGESADTYQYRRYYHHDDIIRKYNLKASWLVPYMNQ